MEAVTIHDLRPSGGVRILAVDLIDILRLCEPEVAASSWRLHAVECFGDLAGDLERLAESDAMISGQELLRLASGVHQIIWGDFEAYQAGEDRFWLVVRAIDSTVYVVITEDQQLLERVRARFQDVRSSPEDANDA
jgi:hypothetical protein